MYLKCFYCLILERTSESCNVASSFVRNCAILPKYGVFKALYLTIETAYNLFDTFPTKAKH